MKYNVHMHRRTVKTVEVFAGNLHDAIKLATESNPEFSAVAIWECGEDPDEPGTEIEGDDYEIMGYCDGCGKPILTGDTYYQWGGEDAVQTCADCGGADDKHEPWIA